MKQISIVSIVSAFLALASASAGAQPSDLYDAGCREITQTFSKTTGKGYGHKGTWTLRLPQGYQLSTYSVSQKSGNPRRKTYSVSEVVGRGDGREGVKVHYNVPNIGNKGAAKLFGMGERSWLAVNVTLTGMDCSRSARPLANLPPFLTAFKRPNRMPSNTSSANNPRSERDSLGIFN